MNIHKIFVGLILLLPLGAHAHVSAISAGTASSGRAAIESYDVPYLNPAGIAYATGYNFATGYSRLNVPEGVGQEEWAVLVSDNMKDTVVPASFAYVQKKDLNPDASWSQRDMRLAIGNFIRSKDAIGFGLVYRNDRSPLTNTQQLNLTAGGLFALADNLGLAVVFENILPLMTDDVAREQLVPLTSVGLSYNLGKYVRLRFDMTSERNNAWNRPLIAGGLENYLNRWLIFRLGASRDAELEQSIYSTGFGFQGPKFGIHYAFQTVADRSGQDQRHSIDLGVPLW